MPKLVSRHYNEGELKELSERIKRHADELARIAVFLNERDIESVEINYGPGVAAALHKIGLFIQDADRATLEEVMR